MFGKSNIIQKLTYVVLAIVSLVMAFNAFQISNINAVGNANPISGQMTSNLPALEYDVIPKGIPRIYGAELGVNYDDVSASDQKKADASIQKLGALDQQIKLSGADKERYIAIASQMSCEYCCGVDSIIFKNGELACGCQHSFAMRGVAKYLIKNHGSEFTDEQILEELSKWKTLFFPAQMSKKAAVLKSKGIDINYINLASNKYRNAENA